ncbi:MAG TPA: 2-hydroxy-acid oxidase, partial [Reyranella sp.]|nr:2-hydroxy-acid oxidase [Reyranella sp.]
TAKAFYDWSGGLIWLALPARDDADHVLVRTGLFGHATLIRAPESVRAAVPVFQPSPPALAALSSRVKESFDPKGLFNPGRMSPV